MLNVTVPRQRIVAAARGWLGTPYHHQASLRGDGSDCLGLIRGIWRELYGEEPEAMPPYTPDWGSATGSETLLAAASRHLIKLDDVSTARPGDLLVFRMRDSGVAKHAGILTPGLSYRRLPARSPSVDTLSLMPGRGFASAKAGKPVSRSSGTAQVALDSGLRRNDGSVSGLIRAQEGFGVVEIAL